MRSDDPAEPGGDTAPALEPVARKILDQIGEQDGAAVAVKKHDLGEHDASAKHDLVDIGRPSRLGGGEIR